MFGWMIAKIEVCSNLHQFMIEMLVIPGQSYNSLGCCSSLTLSWRYSPYPDCEMDNSDLMIYSAALTNDVP